MYIYMYICTYVCVYVYMCLVSQSWPTLCDPVDSSLPGSSLCGDSPGKNPGVSLPCPLPGDLPCPVVYSKSSLLFSVSVLF